MKTAINPAAKKTADLYDPAILDKINIRDYFAPCLEKGYKLTPQRRSIVDTIIKNEGSHLTTEELYDLVKVECPEIGLATVYRTVQLLEEMGVVCKLDLSDGCSRYELVHEEETHHHHHLICTQFSYLKHLHL